MISDEYRTFLQDKHATEKWGTSGARYAGLWVKGILHHHPQIKTVLDFGAGRCTLSESLHDLAEWTNYDPCIPGIDVLPPTQFDLVVTTDCMEHVEPEMIDATIRELGLLSRYMVAFDTPTEGTKHPFKSGPYKGQDEHLIIQDCDWWRDKCSENLEGFELHSYEKAKVYIKGGKRPRARLMYLKCAV